MSDFTPKPQHRFQMDKWEFHSSSHIVFIDSDSLKAQSERLGEETETEVSDTVLEVLSVTVTLCFCIVPLYNAFSDIDTSMYECNIT